MLALRRLRVPHSALLRRANATLQTTTTPDSAPPPVAAATTQPSKPKPAPAPAPVPAEAEKNTTQGRRRRRTPIPPKRPEISLAKPREWNRPVAPNVIPAYDLALDLITKDSYRLTQEAKAVRKEVLALDAQVRELGWGTEEAQALEEELEQKRKKLRILEVQSQINVPEVRWKVANAMADMTNPAHRHLVEQKWRNDGDLDLLMERLHQMNVIPDVLPDLRPTVDIHVVARTTIKERETTQKVHTTVEPGTFLLAGQASATISRDNLARLDVPDEDTQSFRTYLHWLKPNIPLSATTQSRINLHGDTPYIPPHPQQGTPYHRYVLLLLPQPHLDHLNVDSRPLNAEARSTPDVPTSVNLDIPPVTAEERRNFDVRAFVEKWGLNKVPGGGAHMWREVWSQKVSDIYENILKEPEPRFGRPPKEDPYLEYKQRKRYV
ncbi:hypothetical protein H0H92_015961 [Tricholoma furcatifolium]|nr:hypothetical protein H0H92_015961 [Tricholoma furcatifolium]